MSNKQNKPNLLIFIVDQMHPDCFGYTNHPVVKTPNIDKLAKSGMNFTRMYTSQPLCMPARATLFTGLTPRGHKVRMNGIPLDTSIPTFTQELQDAGYHTHCSGKIHLSPGADVKGTDMSKFSPEDFPENKNFWLNGKIKELPLPYYGLESVDYYGGCAHGSYGDYLTWLDENHPDKAHLFYDKTTLQEPSPAINLFNRDSYKWALPSELHPASWIADKSIDFLNNSTNKDRPFCLMCSFQEPHPPFAPPAPYCYRYSEDDVVLTRQKKDFDLMPPHFKKMYEEDIFTSGNSGESMSKTDPYIKECIAHYYGLIEMVDDQVGRVMKTLEDNNLMENTIIMFVADHGESLSEHGMWGKGPYHYDSVIRVPFLVSWQGKITPNTTCEEVTSFIDIAPTILDLLNVPYPQGFVPLVKETNNAPPSLPGKSLANALINGEVLKDTDALIEMDEDYLGFKMRTLVTKKYRLTCYSGQEYGELFDLENDSDEYINLWTDEKYGSIKQELQNRLLYKIIQTDISTPRQLCRA